MYVDHQMSGLSMRYIIRLEGKFISDNHQTTVYYKEGRFHRDDGPAVENHDGKNYWFKDGEPHRLNGPSCENIDGTPTETPYWHINGKTYADEREFLVISRAMKLGKWPDDKKFLEDLDEKLNA